MGDSRILTVNLSTKHYTEWNLNEVSAWINDLEEHHILNNNEKQLVTSIFNKQQIVGIMFESIMSRDALRSIGVYDFKLRNKLLNFNLKKVVQLDLIISLKDIKMRLIIY
eukprot:TRINITY_DN5279_c0_g1_i1.p1 TRINITY_DN5279_c0_g1~~TRINITY_DN5279_c0_g1_i1.p1  ORF type:complete len:123 (+),score=32.08 TRINITY_DN5279_c0_g1_i1:42-371(+)